MMRLIQIPFSHNCVKVRRALELKGLAFETLDIAPMDRAPVLRVSGQGLVPVLEDGDGVVAESTAILRHLEVRYPSPSLLPDGDARRADCWILEDWADAAFMERTRRMAYWNLVNTPGGIEALWFPEARGLRRAVMVRQARKALTRRFRLSAKRNHRDESETRRLTVLALERLAGKARLFEERITVADVALAAMTAPLAAAAESVCNEPAIRTLLDWGGTILQPEITALYSRAAPTA